MLTACLSQAPWHKGLYNCRTPRQTLPLQLMRSLLVFFSIWVNLPNLRIQKTCLICYGTIQDKLDGVAQNRRGSRSANRAANEEISSR